MPEYTSTLLLTFILASCFHKKHIKDWWWFKLGLVSYLASSVAYVLRSPGSILYSIMLLTYYAALTASGVSFVVACFKDARKDIEHLRCLNCGYILKGLSEPRCPECGQKI